VYQPDKQHKQQPEMATTEDHQEAAQLIEKGMEN
jgi:hypothetical protein